jgi:hypothetical protein
VKRPGREADNSLPSIAEVKNLWGYTCTPLYVFLAWCLVKNRDNFTCTLIRKVSFTWTKSDVLLMLNCVSINLSSTNSREHIF